MAEDALGLAEVVAQPYQIASARRYVGLVYRRHGDFHKAIPVLEQCLALSQSVNISRFFPLIASTLGAAYAIVGRVAEALPLLNQVLEHVATGSRVIFHALVLTELSEAVLLVGRVEEASALAERLSSFPAPTTAVATRRMPAVSSVRSPGVASPRTSTRLPPTTARPSA